MNYFTITLILSLAYLTQQRCVYTQPQGGGLPYKVDQPQFQLNYTMEVCKQYIGDKVCCNQANAKLQADNFKSIEGAFSSSAGGCDVCMVNLKRLWCQYACSPRQAQFLTVSQEYFIYPDPQKPGQTIKAQQANLTVEASTACALFQACKRTPFVAAVSAMGSPAGFLNFQGHNAINGALQNIDVYFTFNKSKGLYFNNDTLKDRTKQVTSCDYKGKQLHGFDINATCDCNSCEQACDNSSGFFYSQAQLMQGFNSSLVIITYSSVVGIAIFLSIYRIIKQKRKLKRL